VILLALYVLIANVLLVNLLIAMMSSTYDAVEVSGQQRVKGVACTNQSLWALAWLAGLGTGDRGAPISFGQSRTWKPCWNSRRRKLN
jgi:hypothetical protein